MVVMAGCHARQRTHSMLIPRKRLSTRQRARQRGWNVQVDVARCLTPLRAAWPPVLFFLPATLHALSHAR